MKDGVQSDLGDEPPKKKKKGPVKANEVPKIGPPTSPKMKKLT